MEVATFTYRGVHAINNIVKENGRIDILINNAGYDFFGLLKNQGLRR